MTTCTRLSRSVAPGSLFPDWNAGPVMRHASSTRVRDKNLTRWHNAWARGQLDQGQRAAKCYCGLSPPFYRSKKRIMLIYMQRLSNNLRINMLSTKSNLSRHVLALLVVVQTANYQNTLTYLQCKVFTAERNMEISVATADSCQWWSVWRQYHDYLTGSQQAH